MQAQAPAPVGSAAWLAAIVLSSASCAMGCGPAALSSLDDALCELAVTLSFEPDVPAVGQEAYVCFAYSPSAARSLFLHTIEVRPPADSAVTLHHASLLAGRGPFPDGPVECTHMPEDAVGLYVWVPGRAPLSLPADTAMQLPPDTERLIVQAHVLRVSEGLAAKATVRLCGVQAAPAHLAGAMPLKAPVPAIRPHYEETRSAICTIKQSMHVLSTWPHMHQIGTEFHSSVISASGLRQPLVDVNPWRFDVQQVYPVEKDLIAGDSIETTCVWRNDSEEYVLPGPAIGNEMCGQALMVWPYEAAGCAN